MKLSLMIVPPNNFPTISKTMVPAGGGYYYDVFSAGGWCKTISAANVEAVREDVTTGPWNAGYFSGGVSYTHTYLPTASSSGTLGGTVRMICSFGFPKEIEVVAIGGNYDARMGTIAP